MNNGIDRDSPIPIYYQLKSLIQGQIERGILKPGDQLPTEQELCQLYNISRSPVRQALNELTYEGVITRRAGIGTFVSAVERPKAAAPTPLRVIGTDMRWITVLRRAVQVWNSEQPERPIALETVLVTHDQLHDDLGTAVGGGTAPDIAMMDGVWVAEFAKTGYLFALETLDAAWTQQYAGDLFPAFVEANSYRGRLYGVQLEADVSLLWYRRGWFEAEGLQPPGDWNELVRVAEHFCRPEVVRKYHSEPYALLFPGGTTAGEATVYNLLPFIWSAGGKVFDDGYVALDSPATHATLSFLRDLVRRGISPETVTQYTWDQVPQLFAGGRCAMALGGSYEVGVIKETADWHEREFTEHVGLARVPAAPGREPAVALGGMSCTIFRQSDSPALALGLLQTAARPDLIVEFCRLTLQNSPRKSLTNAFSVADEPFLARTAQTLPIARARPPIPEYARVSRRLQEMFQAAIETTQPIPQIVKRASEYISIITDVPLVTAPAEP